jgi:hypothetical protein
VGQVITRANSEGGTIAPQASSHGHWRQSRAGPIPTEWEVLILAWRTMWWRLRCPLG